MFRYVHFLNMSVDLDLDLDLDLGTFPFGKLYEY